MKKKLIRITTVPYSFGSLLKNQMKYMSDHYDITAISSSEPPGKLEEMTEGQNAKIIPVKMTRKITPIRDFLGLVSLVRIFREERPFIVHTHTPKAGLLGMISAYIAGVPNRLHTVAGMPLLEAVGLKRKILDLVEKLTYTCATKVYPNSQGLYEIIVENGYAPKNKLKVIGEGSSNGIDTQHFNPSLYDGTSKAELRQELNIEPDDFVFVFVGRLVKDKGINELVSAFDRLSQMESNIKLLLVGMYEDELDPLESGTVETIETNTNIVFAGHKKDVRPFLSISNALVFPSYREGFPNVVMESGAMGIPAIVTNINGCNEIIKDGINGIIISPKSERELFDGMLKVLDETFLQQLKNNTREMILSRYERKHFWKKLLKEYQNLES